MRGKELSLTITTVQKQKKVTLFIAKTTATEKQQQQQQQNNNNTQQKHRNKLKLLQGPGQQSEVYLGLAPPLLVRRRLQLSVQQLPQLPLPEAGWLLRQRRAGVEHEAALPARVSRHVPLQVGEYRTENIDRTRTRKTIKGRGNEEDK